MGTYNARVRVVDDIPDLLVGNDNLNEGVYRYDGSTGAFEGFFVSCAALRSPGGLGIGPDDDLYVSGGNSLDNPVLHYDATTGGLLGTLVPTNGGAFGPDGNLYAISTLGSNLLLRYDGQTGGVPRGLRPDHAQHPALSLRCRRLCT